MPFKIGDQVVHPAFGIGHIDAVEEKEYSGEAAQPYYKVTQPRHTMWVRVEAREATGLRLVTARSELNHYRDVLKSLPIPLEKDAQRQAELVSRLRQGSFQGVCEAMRDLTAWSWLKPLNQADTTTLQKTQDSLYQEWAAAAGVSPTEASREIDALLLTNRPAYLGLI